MPLAQQAALIDIDDHDTVVHGARHREPGADIVARQFEPLEPALMQVSPHMHNQRQQNQQTDERSNNQAWLQNRFLDTGLALRVIVKLPA